MKHKIEGKMFSCGQMPESDFTFQMASSLPSTTLRKNIEHSGVGSAVLHHLTTTDAVTGKCFPDMS